MPCLRRNPVTFLSQHRSPILTGGPRGLVLLAVAACSGGTPTTAAQLCTSLSSVVGCDTSEVTACEQGLDAELAAHPDCGAQLDALAACIAPLTLACGGGVSANGEGDFDGPDNYTDMGGYSLIINDAACDRIKRGYDACRTCPEAVGALEIERLGMGDRCEATDECADGLECVTGLCTGACTTDDDCWARAKDCRLKIQHANVCADLGDGPVCARTCTLGGVVDECTYWLDDRWECSADSICEVP